MYSLLFDIVRDTTGEDEMIDEYSSRAVSAELKDFLEKPIVGEYVQNTVMGQRDIKITEWKFSHLKLSLSWLRVWKHSMEPSDIGKDNNMNTQVVEEINHFRDDFDKSEEKIKIVIKVVDSDA